MTPQEPTDEQAAQMRGVPRQMPFYIEEQRGGSMQIWHWPNLVKDATNVTQKYGRVRINFRDASTLELEGAAAQAYWDWQMEQYEMLKAQYDAMRKQAQS